MGAPYTTVVVTGYNDNPPPDDGTESEENRVKWETIKEKLPDPLKTAIEAIDTNIIAAFLKVIGGGGVTSSAISASIGAGDQGKLYRATGAGITITTPDATSVGSPFVVGFVNNASGTVTLDGSGSQTVNGAASITIPPAGGGLLFTDGSNWFFSGVSVAPVGPGQILNGTIAESNGTNATTYALKTLAGADPSAGDPVFACFRNATAATGNYVSRAVTAATSITIPSTATLGAVNATPFDVVVALFDDAGTVRLGVMNPLLASDYSHYPLAQIPPIASSTAIGTGSDSAKTWYTGTGVTSKPYTIVAIARYSSGLTTAGSWNVSPTTLELFGPGTALPGDNRQRLLHIRDEQTSGTAGQTLTDVTWNTVRLNTKSTDEQGITLSSNSFALPAGTHEIEAVVPVAWDTTGAGAQTISVAAQLRLRNTTAAATVLTGMTSFIRDGNSQNIEGAGAAMLVYLRGRFTIAASQTVEVQVYTDGTSSGTITQGKALSQGTEVYADVAIRSVVTF